MRCVRNRAHVVATIALAWHLFAVAAVSLALSCSIGSASEHAGMENCPLHKSAPACPRHGEQHGTHDCDCPTIGCSQTDAGFTALFGTVGVLTADLSMPVPLPAGDASLLAPASPDPLVSAPLSPPPRT